MIILPAIDIKDKQCVRLVKGDYATAHQVAESPYETAKSFKAANASWIHMVDLDGAKERKPVNQEIFERVAKESGLKVEVGGGIRDMKTIEYYLERGIERVILGSVAVKNPELVKEAVKEKVAEVKETTKAAKAAKAETAEKAEPKKTPGRKAAVKEEFVLEFAGKQITQEEIKKKVKENWTKVQKNKIKDIKTIKVFLQPENRCAYYTINDEGNDSYKIEL